ncbi:MAG: Ig-like domain-containing protein [Pseudomonadota bacterium]
MHMIALEPRIVLDAAALETVAEISQQSAHQQFADEFLNQMNYTEPGAGSSGQVEPPQNEIALPAGANSGKSEIVFISSDIEDIEPYLSNLPANAEVIIIDVAEDGIDQMSMALANRSDIDAIHLITHGDEGLLQFGDATIDAGMLAGHYQQQLTQIGATLTENGDFLIYGCDFGSGDTGREALELLAQLTGADVAGSDDATGHQDQQGDWDLEVASGEIETQALSAENWENTLADPYITSNGGGYYVFVNMDENQTYATTVTADDDDLPSDTLTFSIFGGYDAGDFTIDPTTGVLSFIAPPDYENPTDNIFTNGIYTVGVAVVDSSNNYDTQYISVVVKDVNDAPVATGNSVATNEDDPLVIPASAFTFSDDDGDSLQSVTLTNFNLAGGTLTHTGDTVTVTEGMTITVAELADLTYTPLANSSANASFDYVANDAASGTVSASMVITVNAVDDPPSVTGPDFTTGEDLSYNGSVLMTDADAGDTPEATLGAAPANGLVVVNTDGTYSYTPNADFSGSDSFSIVATDDAGLTDAVVINVTVTPVNDAPVATSGPVATAEDTVLNGSVSISDVDIGDTPEATLHAPTSNGTVVVNTDGTYSYTPNTNFFGSDSFSVLVTDDDGLTDTVTVNITVTAENDAPEAFTDTVNIPEDVPTALTPTTPYDIDDVANDLTVTIDQLPTAAQGVVSYTADGGGTVNPTVGAELTLSEFASLSFSPSLSYAGVVDPVLYTVRDDEGHLDGDSSGSINLIINGSNDAPVAATQAITVIEDVATPLNPTLPSDVDDAPTDLSIQVTQVPAGAQGQLTYTLDAGGTATVSTGTLMSVNEFSSLVFTPATNYEGTVDAFTYRVTDDDGASNADSIGTINLSINAQNDLPAGSSPDITVSEDQVHNGVVTMSDPDLGDTPEATLSSAPSNGTAVVNTDGTYTYTPNANYSGADSFSILVTDDAGAHIMLTINVTVTAQNDAPTITASNSTTSEDTTVNSSVSMTDPDLGDIPVASLGSGPSNGFVTVNADGTYTYTPLANFAGSDNFSVVATDGSGATFVKEITVTVTPVNDAPIGVDATHTVAENTPFNATLTMSDVDVGDTPEASLKTAPTNGVAVVNSDGTYTYTPNTGFSGFDSFVIEITDDTGLTDTAMITLNVAFANDAPTVSADPIATQQDTPVSGSISFADPDPGDVPVASLAKVPENGSVIVNADGTYIYTPASGFAGVDRFDVMVTDNLGLTATTNVTVTITAAPPVAAASSAAAFASSAAAFASVSAGSEEDDNAASVGSFDTFEVAFDVAAASSGSTDAGDNSSNALGVESFEALELGLKETVSGDEAPSKQASLVLPENANPAPFKPTVQKETAAHQAAPETSENILSVEIEKELEDVELDTKNNLKRLEQDLELKYETLFKPMQTAQLTRAVEESVDDLRNSDKLFGVAIDKVTYAFGSLLSVGGVSFVLRGGVMAAAMMSAIPAWARFDPITIVSSNDEEDQDEAEEISEAELMTEFVRSARALVSKGTAA